MTAKDFSIPVSAPFEKRLAELVWENCPELARQTAAGKLALSLDFDSQNTQDKVIRTLVSEAVAELRSTVIPAAQKYLESGEPIKEIVDRVRSDLQRKVEMNLPKVLDNEIRTAIDQILKSTLRNRVVAAANDYFGQMFAKIIAERVDALVDSHLKRRLSTNDRAQESIQEGEHRLQRELVQP